MSVGRDREGLRRGGQIGDLYYADQVLAAAAFPVGSLFRSEPYKRWQIDPLGHQLGDPL